ncbi:2-succinyl-5-enolpyruvyl-6-hydroxy-3-cyclohexene-1-carboxylic-acid synthase [Tenacibaculum maritimum]|uniref:2-succinyl-5-enolpyruvyl-6-hydroxy-3- cyclohexene-1-carboxylic-acid synthase n=1 Tax=Tenacibaculum maritimum TaxID=107401 RepID=UPI003876850B
MFPKKELAQTVIAACHQFDINTVVISPGSRNAPLTIGFSNHPEIEALSIVDERCAAFFALGIAQQTQKPVGLVCSSGSALLNYYPAIAEAFYSNIPLVVISADRPKELIDIGDGQTIRQENVFENHILFAANLKEAADTLEENSDLLAKALFTATYKKGPIHINVPFKEPLYETVDVLAPFVLNQVKKSFSTTYNNRFLKEEKAKVNYETFLSIWNSSAKKIILIGSNFPSEKIQEALALFAEDDTVLIMTETISNVHHPNFINAIDQLIFSLKEEDFEALKPEILVTLGGMVVSKKVKQFLRNHPPQHHWHIDENNAIDTYYCLTEFVQESPSVFLEKLAKDRKNRSSNFQYKWLKERAYRREKHQKYLNSVAYSDLKVFEEVLKSIPEESQLQLSNSSVIRYTQLFSIQKSLAVFCNRGTSGIDGSTSTAIGAAIATNKKQTVFITGDLSFFYDSNALWNNYIPNNFRIILINNSGGGIFRFIPGPKTTNAIDYFETSHNLTAVHLCKMYGFEYCFADTVESLQESLQRFYEKGKQPKILEISTPKEINDVVLQNYFKQL